MKVITIGRDTDNDFVVYDSKVSRHHLQIINDGCNYRIVDFNTTNGTFVFDTGASSICISTLEAALLYKKGVFSKNDIIDYERFVTASGEISIGAKIILKTVQIGDKILNDVEATIIENPNAECLLGQTVLSRFGTYKIDNANKEIVFE